MRTDIAEALRAAAKEAIKLGLMTYAKAATVTREARGAWSHLVAEARHELGASSPSERVAQTVAVERVPFPDHANTFTLTRERLRAWHRYASEIPAHAQQACVICVCQQGGLPWPAVVHWLEEAGFAVCQSEEETVEIRNMPGHDANDLYHLVSGRGNWV